MRKFALLTGLFLLPIGAMAQTDTIPVVSIVQPEQLYEEGDTILMEFRIEPKQEIALNLVLDIKTYIVSDTYGEDLDHWTFTECSRNPWSLPVRFDSNGVSYNYRSEHNNSLFLHQYSENSQHGRVHPQTGETIYDGGKLSHIEVTLSESCNQDYEVHTFHNSANYITREHGLNAIFEDNIVQSTEAVSNRVESAFESRDDTFSFKLSGMETPESLILAGGRLANNGALDWDATFALNLSPTMAIWGDGNVQSLDGTLGFDVQVSSNMLFGLAGSLNDSVIPFNNGEYLVDMTSLNPYLHFKSDDWDQQLLLMTGYGTGELQAKSDSLNYSASGELYMAYIEARSGIYRNLSVVGNGWAANQILTDNSIMSHNVNLSLEATSDLYNSVALVGAEYDSDTDFDAIINLSAEIGIFSPYVKYEVFSTAYNVGSVINYNEDIQFEIASSREQELEFRSLVQY